MVKPCLQNLLPVTLGEVNSKIQEIGLNDVRSFRGVGWSATTINALKRFPHLTELKLSNCKDVINDDILQAICQNLTKCCVFYFGGSDDITDYGLTGVRNGGVNTGISLSFCILSGAEYENSTTLEAVGLQVRLGALLLADFIIHTAENEW